MKSLSLCAGVSLALVSILSCKSAHTDVVCTTGSLLIYPAGFDSTDFASVTALRYKQNNAFDSLIDTIPVNYEATVTDTGYLNMQDPAFATRMQIIEEAGLNPGYDYKIMLPAIGRTYLITHIVQSGITDHVFSYDQSISAPNGPPRCFNNIVSIQINGVTYACAQSLEYSTARMFLVK